MNPKTELSDQELEALLRGAGRLESAPDAVLRRAIGVFKAAPPSLAQTIVRQVMAVLRFDSGVSAPLAFGLRSSSGNTRQLLFSGDVCDIDLRVTPVAGARGALWTVRGQILGPDQNATVELSAPDYTATVALNEMAEFCFDEVPRGECRLVLRTTDCVIQLPAIQIPLAD